MVCPHKSAIDSVRHYTALRMEIAFRHSHCIQGSYELMAYANLRSSSASRTNTASDLVLAGHAPVAGDVPSLADTNTC